MGPTAEARAPRTGGSGLPATVSAAIWSAERGAGGLSEQAGCSPVAWALVRQVHLQKTEYACETRHSGWSGDDRSPARGLASGAMPPRLMRQAPGDSSMAPARVGVPSRPLGDASPCAKPGAQGVCKQTGAAGGSTGVGAAGSWPRTRHAGVLPRCDTQRTQPGGFHPISLALPCTSNLLAVPPTCAPGRRGCRGGGGMPPGPTPAAGLGAGGAR